MWILITNLFLGTFANLVSAAFTQLVAIRILEEPYEALPDIIHIFTPKINSFIPDYFLGSSALYALTSYNDLENVEKNLSVFAICLYIRSVTMFLTIMPTCMPYIQPVKQSYYSSLFHTSHDLMFSGHSLCFFLIGNITNTPIINYVGPFLLVVARQHYTIDVLVSALVYNYVYLLH
jgi:hypothetical protein